MLEFNEERHEYKLDGVILPSVTQVIKSAGLVDDTFYDEYSCRRGTAVHLATALYDEGTLDESTVADEIKGYLAGWVKFLKESKFKVREAEQLLSHPVRGYAGTRDRRGFLNDKWTILDIKTGALNPAVGVQLAAYKHLSAGDDKTYTVQLKANGTYALKKYDDPADWTVFMACLNLYKWRKNHNQIKETK